MTETAPPPLEWHPYYRDHTHLLDWLNDTGPLAGSSSFRIARPTRPSLSDFDGTEWHPSPPHLVLTKRTAAGLAPYVGRPFVYVWNVATDQLGRSIAGESRIQYSADAAEERERD